MSQASKQHLSRRESQVMDIVYESGRATAEEIRQRLPDPPSNSAVRALLRVLVGKGHLRYEYDGPRYVFMPTVPRENARDTALEHLLKTFFDGSAAGAVAALLDLEGSRLSDEECQSLSEMIDQARKEGR